MTSDRRHQGPKIEGGVDAVVLGASQDALAASALLAKAGLHVVEIETGAGKLRERREFAPGYFADDGEPIAVALDHGVIDALDLYRHGLSYARRRLETLVRFGDGAALVLPGDPALAGEFVAAFSEADAAPFAAFMEDERRAARSLATWFAGGEAPTVIAGPTADASTSSIDGAILGRFADPRLEDYLRAEAAFGAASRPSHAYSWFALSRRLSGETAGLQGALAAIEGGGRALADAIRRAGQAFGVVTRQTDRVRKVIVERDRVTGVEFDDGGQIRAPIIISALPARETFLDFIGRARLDVEFARALDAPPPRLASVRAHLAVNGPITDALIATKMDRRFLFAPDAAAIDRGYNVAEEGAAAATLAELVFPSAFNPGLAPQGCATASLTLHPVAFRPSSDEAWRGGVEAAARALFGRLADGGAAQVTAIELDDAIPATAPLLAVLDRRRRFVEASGLDGYFFCGPEAHSGRSQSLSPGRRAAERAIRYFKDGGGEP